VDSLWEVGYPVQITGDLFGVALGNSDLGSSSTPWGRLYLNGLYGAAISDGHTGSSSTIAVSKTALAAHVSNVTHGSSTNGTVISVAAGSGMSFSTITSSGAVSLGSPSTCTVYTSNAVSGSTHTHALSISSGGDPDQNLWSTFNLSSNGGSNSGSASTASSTTDTFLFIAGSGVTLTGGTDSLTIAASSSGGGYFTGNAGTNNKFAYYSGGDELYSSNNNNTPATIYSKGGYFQCNVTSLYFQGLSSTGGTDLILYNNTTVYLDSSSRRYKENIIDLTIDTSKIYDLVPRTFKWKDTDEPTVDENGTIIEPTILETITGPIDFGLIAEEVHEVLPELVRYNKKNEPNAVKYKVIAVLLLEEMKKLKARIEVLEGN